MVTLGFDAPNGEKWLVEVGPHDEENGGRWAIRLTDDAKREPIGGCFFAHDAQLF